MKKINQRGFIQIPLLIGVIVSIAIISVGAYGGFGYYKTSKLIKEADQFSKEERYGEAIEKLNLAQANWFVSNLGIKKQEISDKEEENNRLSDELSKYSQGLDEFNKGNLQETIDLLAMLPENSFYYQRAQTKIEEAKRIIIEGELEETKIAKDEAEEKAQQEAIKRSQEEMARKAKEQELASREAQEKMMDADNDGDGLTYRQELELGTSDWDTDSDGDGILDNLDAHPAGGGRLVSQTFEWSYGGYNWTYTTAIHEDWFNYYRAKPRESHPSRNYITSDDPFVKKISQKISEGAKGDVDKVWLAISFVQNLPYIDDIFTGYDEYPKYPIETFFEKNGDCEDTSYLAASIIDAMDKGVILVLLPGHMAVGIYMDCDTPGTYYELDGRCYYYVETTSKDFAGGEIPDKYKNTRATLIDIYSGKTTDVYPQYVKPCYASSDFLGYYCDGNNYYIDSRCSNLVYCLPYEDLYYDSRTESFYWDGGCNQIIMKGCYKSLYHPGYFYDDYNFYYYDSRCTQQVDL
jgi:hypothetical protein